MTLGMTTDSYSYDNFIAGETQIETKEVEIASGEGVVADYTVLGKANQAVGTVVVGSGNTGDGTINTPTLGTNAKLGTYQVRLSGATTFYVLTPEGEALADGSTGVDYVVGDQIKFKVTAGSTPFAAGDTFDIPVNRVADPKYKVCKATNVDGSQYPDCILVEGVDATSAPKTGLAYIKGVFNTSKVVVHSSLVLAEVEEDLENIIFRSVED